MNRPHAPSQPRPCSAHPELTPASASVAVRGHCQGYRVRSDHPLPLLRAPFADGTDLEIARHPVTPAEPAGTPLRRWAPTADNPGEQRLHRLDDGFGIWIDGLGSYHVKPAAPRITVTGSLNAPRWATRLWGIPTALCFTAIGDHSLHAAAVQVESSALLITAPGRFGKTTLAAGFAQAGHRVLSEDICRCSSRDEPTVYPGPAVLRLRPDMSARLGKVPGTGIMFDGSDRTHLAFDPSSTGDGRPVPIRGILALAPSNGPVTFERLDVSRALPLLWTTSFNLPDTGDRARCFLGISALFERVPVWRLARPLDAGQLPTLVERIVETCLP